MKKLALAIALVLCIGIGAQAQLAAYSQDFEGMNLPADGDPSLANDGWLVFANVFSSGGGYLYGYGPFTAPNNANNPAFSNVTTGQGGVPQGDRQLVVFSDYNNGDHGVGNLIEANVFQEFTNIGSGDYGTWTFTYDGKRGDLGGATTALAFIKTLDPNNGFALTNFETIDMTTASTNWNTYSISIDVDSSLDGQILQIGFASTASNYEPSGVFYDNVNFAIPEPSSVALLAMAAGGLWGFRRRFMG